jgi:hypothetical protein
MPELVAVEFDPWAHDLKACVIHPDGRALRFTADAPSPQLVEGPTARAISLGFLTCLATPDGELWCARPNRTPSRVERPFAVAQVVPYSDGALCVRSDDGQVACADPDEQPRWRAIVLPEGRRAASIVRVGSPAALFVLDSDGGLWCEGAAQCARLVTASRDARLPSGAVGCLRHPCYERPGPPEPPPSDMLEDRFRQAYPGPAREVGPVELTAIREAGRVRRMRSDGGNLCLERAAPSDVVCISWSQGPHAMPVPDGLRDFAPAGNNLCTLVGEILSCTYFDWPHPHDLHARQDAPRVTLAPRRVPNAIRLHAGGAAVCTEASGLTLHCAIVRGIVEVREIDPIRF